MFNLFISIFRPNICSFIWFFYSTLKLQSIEALVPSPFPLRLSVISRTNESQVGILRYINKIANSFISTNRTNICSSIYFSYSTFKMQSIEALIPSPFATDYLSYRVQTTVRSDFCRIKIKYLFFLFLIFKQFHVLLAISFAARLKCNRLGHKSTPHSP